MGENIRTLRHNLGLDPGRVRPPSRDHGRDCQPLGERSQQPDASGAEGPHDLASEKGPGVRLNSPSEGWSRGVLLRGPSPDAGPAPQDPLLVEDNLDHVVITRQAVTSILPCESRS
jgi:hypothetical protein